MAWLEALILGLVQGVTEFLPISSDGHLVVTQQAFAILTGTKRKGSEDLFFDLMLHLGTLAAIVVYYRAVVRTGAKGLLGSDTVAPEYRRGALMRTAVLVGIATTPLVPLKLFFMRWIESTFESLTAAGVGFLITAAVLLSTFWLQRKDEGGKGPRETTWLDALLIGIAQMFAPLPGVSRSGLTVATALGLGLSRSWAVGFSLLIAFPAIVGGSFFAILKLMKLPNSTITGTRVGQIVSAAVLAGIVGYGAIIWLVKIVRSGRMWYFSVYLIVLGVAVIAASLSQGVTADAKRENAADGAVRGGRVGAIAAPGGGSRRPERPLASPFGPGLRAAPGTDRASGGGHVLTPGLVLGRPLAGRPRGT